MTSRLAPPHLNPSVRQSLADELDTLTTLSRPRGKAGIGHDRRVTYLTTMIANTVEADTAEAVAAKAVAGPGALVSVRFASDAEHRTYQLHDDTTKGSADGVVTAGAGVRPVGSATLLPLSWRLGQALTGTRAGDTVTYQAGDTSDTPTQVTVLAVWTTDDRVWQLPEHDTGA
jgi:transcription elongation GreA/GreB family factor